jgi:polysaccharide export outer membrane protein
MRTTALILFVAVAGAQNRPSSVVDQNVANVANLPAQKIASNDLLGVSVYDAPELTRTVRVSADGAIRLPMLNVRLQAEGLMPADLEGAITAALKSEDILVDPIVTVTVLEYNSRPISVVGAVRKPVTFQAVGRITLLEAIARAEGLTSDAGPEILITRAQPADGVHPGDPALNQRITVRDLVDGGRPDLNLALTGGEEIRIPEARKIFVVGNVKRPGSYAVRDESGTTVLKILALAEGLSPYSNKTAFIYRREGAGVKNEIPIELKRILDRKAPDVPLQAEDILYVPDNSGRRLSAAVIEKVLVFGSTAGATALIYGRVVR